GRASGLEVEVPREDLGAYVARGSGNRSGRVAGGARVVQVGNRGAVAEVIVHHLFGIEGADEDVAATHIDYFLNIFAVGVDISPENIFAGHVWTVACKTFDDLVGKVFLEGLVRLTA